MFLSKFPSSPRLCSKKSFWQACQSFESKKTNKEIKQHLLKIFRQTYVHRKTKRTGMFKNLPEDFPFAFFFKDVSLFEVFHVLNYIFWVWIIRDSQNMAFIKFVDLLSNTEEFLKSFDTLSTWVVNHLLVYSRFSIENECTFGKQNLFYCIAAFELITSSHIFIKSRPSIKMSSVEIDRKMLRGDSKGSRTMDRFGRPTEAMKSGSKPVVNGKQMLSKLFFFFLHSNQKTLLRCCEIKL